MLNKFFDLIYNLFADTYLFEQITERHDLDTKACETIEKVFEIYLCIKLMPNSEKVLDWKQEICNHIRNLEKFNWYQQVKCSKKQWKHIIVDRHTTYTYDDVLRVTDNEITAAYPNVKFADINPFNTSREFHKLLRLIIDKLSERESLVIGDIE